VAKGKFGGGVLLKVGLLLMLRFMFSTKGLASQPLGSDQWQPSLCRTHGGAKDAWLSLGHWQQTVQCFRSQLLPLFLFIDSVCV
jgi:hypothetical protein